MNTLTCEAAETLIASAALDSPLAPEDDAALHEHLYGCAACRSVAHDFTDIAEGLPLALDVVQPSARLRERVLAIASAQEEVSPAPFPLPQAARRRWRAPQLRTLGYGALAAAVAVAAFVGGRVSTHPVTPVAEQVFSVAGTTSEPAARGSLAYDASTQQTVLTVTGLPELTPSPGQQSPVYEVWLVRSDRSVNGVAFLTRQPGGTWTTEWHGSLHSYVAVAATVEPYGGSPAPTSPQVLEGEVSGA